MAPVTGRSEPVLASWAGAALSDLVLAGFEPDSFVEIELLGAAELLDEVEIDVLGDADPGVVEISVGGLVVGGLVVGGLVVGGLVVGGRVVDGFDVVGAGLELTGADEDAGALDEVSPSPSQTMMWLIALSPPLPPGSYAKLPFVSAHTVSPAEASSNSVLVYGSTFLLADFTTTRA
jgi:hypothetical protein